MKGEHVGGYIHLPFPRYTIHMPHHARERLKWCEDNINGEWRYFQPEGTYCHIHIIDEEYRMAYILRWLF